MTTRTLEEIVRSTYSATGLHGDKWRVVEAAIIEAASRASPEEGRAAKALRGLVEALDRCHADPRYQNVWTLAQVHGGQYVGPRYVDELAFARLARLSPPPPEETATPDAEIVRVQYVRAGRFWQGEGPTLAEADRNARDAYRHDPERRAPASPKEGGRHE